MLIVMELTESGWARGRVGRRTQPVGKSSDQCQSQTDMSLGG